MSNKLKKKYPNICDELSRRCCWWARCALYWVAVNFFVFFHLYFSHSITIAICADDDRKHVTLFSIFMSNQFKSPMISLARWFLYGLRFFCTASQYVACSCQKVFFNVAHSITANRCWFISMIINPNDEINETKYTLHTKSTHTHTHMCIEKRSLYS